MLDATDGQLVKQLNLKERIMCTPISSTSSKGLIPFLKRSLMTVEDSTDVKIQKISNTIISQPCVKIHGRLLYFEEHKTTSITTYYPDRAFNIESYEAELGQQIKEILNRLKKQGSYVQLCCTLLVEGTQKRKDGSLASITKTITRTLNGFTKADELELALWGPEMPSLEDDPVDKEAVG
jgi:hypothetical protein